MRYIKFVIPAIIFTLALSCNLIKIGNTEMEIRTFLVSFQSSLALPDKEILKQFKTRQSAQSLLQVIRILQNKDEYVMCDIDFEHAKITAKDNGNKTDIPVHFRMREDNSRSNDTLTLWITSKDKKFIISDINGEKFYQDFVSFKNDNDWKVARQREYLERKATYDLARNLQQKFDTVIWYTKINGEAYFYVVEGTWKNYFLTYATKNERNTDVKMGVVNAAGEIIIPIEYDLIGTFAFDHPDLVEVKKDGKTGYFNIQSKKLVVAPEYDMIVPYATGLSIVKQDTIYGWMDSTYQYTPGFPTEQAKEWMLTFGFLKKSISFNKGSHNYCEIPNTEYTGFGIIMPPSYLVYTGIFNEIDGGISTTEIPVRAWTDYIKVDQSLFEKLSSKVNALLTSITKRYIDGREEFYISNRVAFLNERNDTLAIETVGGTNSSVRAIDSTLLEVRTEPHWEYYVDLDVDNLPLHTYFSVTRNGNIIKLKSLRVFPQTEFVKLDSSYLSESYKIYDRNAGGWIETTAVSVKTLRHMKNEILFEYGYRFKEDDDAKSLTNSKDYHPKYDAIEEFEDKLSDIDRHNLEFLERMIAQMKGSSV